ncbi:MAG: hypothetical protein AAGN66_14865 [Acidobacteriota bacterium]
MPLIGLLEYTFKPPAVFAGQTVDFELVISNPLGGDPVVFAGGRPQDADQLQIDVATTGEEVLTDSLDFTAAVTAQPELPDPPGSSVPFSVILVGTSFFVKPQGTDSSSTSTLRPGQSLTVTFANLKVDPLPGTGAIEITQLIGVGTTPTGTLRVEKKPQEPGIVAWFDEPLIAGGATGTLRWTARGGTSLDVKGFPYGPGSKTFPLDGPPPVSGDTPASILESSSSQTYTLDVVQPGSGTVASVQRTLQFHPPFISLFAPTRPLPLRLPAKDPVELQYATAFTATARLVTPIQAQPLPNPSNGSVTLVPGDDAYRIGGNTTNIPGTVNYTLEAQGYLNPALRTLSVSLAPIEVLYFKFLQDDDGVLSRAQALLAPETWRGQQIETEGSDLLVLTVWGPGGQRVQRFLGDGDTVHPQIQYFEIDAVDGDAVEVSWVTANLTKLVLDPGGIEIPLADIPRAQGFRVDLGGADRIVLTGTAASGETAPSVLPIQPASPSRVRS